MAKYLITVLLLVPVFMLAAPPKEIPPELLKAYTMDDQIPILPYYIDGTYSSHTPIVFSKEKIDTLIRKACKKEQNYYGITDKWLYQALRAFPIRGKKVAVIGSVEPWYESIVLACRGHPVTIEYNKIMTDDPRLTIMTVNEYNQNPQKFDVVLSISSIEHDGLGRYGDPIDPDGDLKTMSKIKSQMLSPGGICILAIPIGQDAVCWNAHRIYGKIRLPLLLKEWNILQTFGLDETTFQLQPNMAVQPVLVLSPK